MLSSARPRIGQSQRLTTRIPTLCIVDPQVADYQAWHALAESSGVRLQFATSAEEALRIARTTVIDQWVVNTQLPGLSGCELCAMLRSRSPGVPIVLVSDTYSESLEREAYRVRASLFAVKSAGIDWWAEWLNDAAPRAVERVM